MTTIGNYTSDKITSMMALFKAVPADAWTDSPTASLEDCLLRGFVFVGVHGVLMDTVPLPLFILAEDLYGIDKKVNNQTFWKSFERVRDMDPREYVMHQIAHYFSTYGMEMIGQKARTYVPVQDLDIPDTMLPFNRMTVIRCVTNDDMVGLINHYALVTVAPSPVRIAQFKSLMEYLTIKTDDIKSFELQVIKHDMDGTVPAVPQSFLRYLVYKTTGSTLLIKNRATRKSIQSAALDYSKANLPHDLLSKANPAELATIFFRYRPIFLAFKKFDGCAPIINHIRRLADKHHVPMGDVSVQNFINLVLARRTFDMETVLRNASNRELVKLINFLQGAYHASVKSSMTKEVTPGVYNIRNGRTFVRSKPTARGYDDGALILAARNRVYDTLRSRLSKVLRGKKFFMPEYISYAAPVSEKQFIGNIPWGSRVTAFDPDQAFTTGISWFNQNGTRVDIDLHLNSATRHYGWNGGYTDGQDIIYTGDQTDAPEPNGAAEAYYFNPTGDTYILSANLFCGVKDMPYKMFMTSKKPIFDETYTRRSFRPHTNYTFDPADALFAPIPLKFSGDARDMTIGMFAEKMFFFYGGSVNNGIVPSANYVDFINGLTVKLRNMMAIETLLEDCGAWVMDQEEYNEETDEERKAIISLAPEDLTATTLLDIIDGNI